MEDMSTKNREIAPLRRRYKLLLTLLMLVGIAAWAPWDGIQSDSAKAGLGLNAPAWLGFVSEADPRTSLDEWRAEPATAAVREDVDALLERALELENGWQAVEDVYDERVAPIERVLLRYRNDPDLARRIAVALVREARRAGLEPRVLLAVLLVENPWIDPDARSFVGAVGLMQVMPLHRGHWGECGDDLESIDSNICHGAQIFAHYFRRTGGDVERALLRYNGCVNGTNTPDCHRYPYHVYARAGKASMFAWLEARPESATGGAASP